MKILVTGGNGFIGYHLIKELLQQNHQVRCLVLESEPVRDIKHLPVEIATGDVCDAESLKPAVKDVDIVYHLAGIKNAWEEETFFRVNYGGTKTLFETALSNSNRLKRFVFMSTQAAAGPSEDGHPITEDEACNPLGSYGKSKLAGEEYLLKNVDKAPVTILRPASVNGSYNRGNSVIGLIIRTTRWGFAPSIYSSGPYMNMIHVSDAVEALKIAAVHDNAIGQIYFIASREPCSWQDIIRLTFQAWDKKGLTIPLPPALLRAGGSLIKGYRRLLRRPYKTIDEYVTQMLPMYYVCSGEKAERELGFVARVSLEKGIDDSVQWFRGNGMKPVTV